MRKANKRLTPDNIISLSDCEIFVFGSNLAGQHHGGAARTAHRDFGAEWGIGNGPTGRCYAIPTMHGGVADIKPYVDEFIEYAKSHPNNRFLVTRIGCGIAGFKDDEIAPLFQEALEIPNIALPKKWLPILLIDITLGLAMPKGHASAPDVMDEKVLTELCQKHLYEIGTGIYSYLPEIRIRYVMANEKFGYAKFGDFFFNEGKLYIWHTDDGWAYDHEQDVVQRVFGDQCYQRGYAVEHLFAGVRTNFQDTNNEWIYTGDVLKIQNKHSEEDDAAINPVNSILALSTLNIGHSRKPIYSFALDNHDWELRECATHNYLTRIGTVFYQLYHPNWPENLRFLTMEFNGWYDTNEQRLHKALKARYTPNYDQEEWKYSGLEILGCEEFNWRK